MAGGRLIETWSLLGWGRTHWPWALKRMVSKAKRAVVRRDPSDDRYEVYDMTGLTLFIGSGKVKTVGGGTYIMESPNRVLRVERMENKDLPLLLGHTPAMDGLVAEWMNGG